MSSNLVKISSTNKKGNTVEKFLVKYNEIKNNENLKSEFKKEETTKNKEKPEIIKVSAPDVKKTIFVKSKTPYVMIKGRILPTYESNKNKIYPHHKYVFKQDINNNNWLYIVKFDKDMNTYLKRLFKTTSEKLTLNYKDQHLEIDLKTRFKVKGNKIITEKL